jgi:hypothetical protein
MANEGNLIPFSQRTEKEQRAIRSKGGRTKTPKRKWAARLREMKKKGLTDENYKRIVAWMEEPESSAMDIFLYLESVKKHCNNASQMNNVANSQINLMKAHHGEKHNIRSENIHHIVNWTQLLTADKMSEDATNFKRKDKTDV